MKYTLITAIVFLIIPRFTHGQNYIEEVNDINLEMIFIRGGEFQTGSPEDEPDRYSKDSREAQATVTVGDFYISKYEITQDQFLKIDSGYEPYSLADCDTLCPVGYVAWWDAIRFCNYLSEAAGLELCYEDDGEGGLIVHKSANGYRLPTEAEWEYAAKGGANGKLNYIELRDSLAWHKMNSTSVHPVGQKMANEFGLYDMFGNLWEWCFDEHHSAYSQYATYRMVKGGAYAASSEYCRPAASTAFVETVREPVFGLRVVRNIPNK